MRLLLFFLFITCTSGCAYRFGLSDRSLPGGYTQVAIPVFKNKSQEVGIEPYFTNSLIRHFARSGVARVTDSDTAPVVLVGEITEVRAEQGPALTNDPNSGLRTLPDTAVLVTSYRMIVTAALELRRKSDDKVVWKGSFHNEKVYSTPQIGAPVVNSADATYNHSARMQKLSELAEEMMTEAHDRVTENF